MTRMHPSTRMQLRTVASSHVQLNQLADVNGMIGGERDLIFCYQGDGSIDPAIDVLFAHTSFRTHSVQRGV
jgi:hypothetical protein